MGGFRSASILGLAALVTSAGCALGVIAPRNVENPKVEALEQLLIDNWTDDDHQASVMIANTEISELKTLHETNGTLATWLTTAIGIQVLAMFFFFVGAYVALVVE